jgi:hypothetical protein
MQTVCVIWIDGQNLAVKRDSLFQLPALMQAHCFSEQAFNMETSQPCAFPLKTLCTAALRPRDVDKRSAAEALRDEPSCTY